MSALVATRSSKGQVRLELEDARRAAAGKHAIDLRVVERHVVHRVRFVHGVRVGMAEFAQPLLHRADGVVDHRQRLEAQEVHLQHPGVLEAVHVVLRDNVWPGLGAGRPCPATPAAAAASLALGADRHVVAQRPRCDHHAGRVHRRVARQSFQGDRVVEQPFVTVIGTVQHLDVPDPLHRLGHCIALARLVRDHLRNTVGFPHVETQDPAHVPDDRPALHRPEGDDLADRVTTVLVTHVLDHLTPALVAEVDIDVGHRDPLGIEESFEEESVLDRVQVRDLKRIGHQRPRRGPSAGPDGDTLFARPANEIPGNEEIARIPRLHDDRQFVVEAFADCFRERILGRPASAGDPEP